MCALSEAICISCLHMAAVLNNKGIDRLFVQCLTQQAPTWHQGTGMQYDYVCGNIYMPNMDFKVLT